jgi:hypothetical protein
LGKEKTQGKSVPDNEVIRVVHDLNYNWFNNQNVKANYEIFPDKSKIIYQACRRLPTLIFFR